MNSLGLASWLSLSQEFLFAIKGISVGNISAQVNLQATNHRCIEEFPKKTKLLKILQVILPISIYSIRFWDTF